LIFRRPPPSFEGRSRRVRTPRWRMRARVHIHTRAFGQAYRDKRPTLQFFVLIPFSSAPPA
jgi:hypothetical protein